MFHQRIVTCSALIGGLLLLAPADGLAQETYLLQLGSFEQREEAASRWESLQRKYPELLDGFSLRVLDVTLPPDNFTVYRTQAGPLKSKANADLVCERLNAKGDECYVVETAMFKPDAAPGEVPNPPLTVEKDAFEVSAPSEALPPAPAADEMTPADADTNAASDASHADQTPPQRQAQQQTQVEPQEMAEADDSPADGLLADGSPAAADKIDETSRQQKQPDVSEPAPARESRADDASPASGASAAAAMAAKTAQTTAEAGGSAREADSFWSFLASLNPFAAGEQPAPEAATSPEPVPSGSETASAAPAPLIDAKPLAEADKAAADDALPWRQAPGSRYRSLPTPPSPPNSEAFRLQSERQLDEALARGAVRDAVPFAIGRSPSALDPAAGPPAPDADAMVAPPPAVQAGERANVTVAEAVPVPLSQAQDRMPEALPRRALGLPSQQTPRRKSLWAQLRYFADQSSALAYWQQVQQAMPDLPPMRVRVTTPYLSHSAAHRVSLRIGPFARADRVLAFCEQVQSERVTCQPLADLGTSASRRASLASRYERQARRNYGEEEMYWVQLGTFPAKAAAEEAWQQMQMSHEDILGARESAVVAPALTSGYDARFRLRSGPYAMRHEADALCNTLEMRGDRCAVVFSR